jgi:hypothetical protein
VSNNNRYGILKQVRRLNAKCYWWGGIPRAGTERNRLTGLSSEAVKGSLCSSELDRSGTAVDMARTGMVPQSAA